MAHGTEKLIMVIVSSCTSHSESGRERKRETKLMLCIVVGD